MLWYCDMCTVVFDSVFINTGRQTKRTNQMNLVDCYVTQVLSKPYYDDFGSTVWKWWVDVVYDSYGVKSRHTLMFDTKEEAESVKIGYRFLS